METSVVTTKGQIVIPARLRKKFGLKKGIKVFLEEKGNDIIIHPATPSLYDRTYGILKGSGLTKLLTESRQEEKRREEAKIEKR